MLGDHLRISHSMQLRLFSNAVPTAIQTNFKFGGAIDCFGFHVATTNA